MQFACHRTCDPFCFLYFAHKALCAQIKYRSFVLSESQAYFPLLCMLMLLWWRFIIERENHRNRAPVCYVPFFVFLSSILHVFFLFFLSICSEKWLLCYSFLLGCVFVVVTVFWRRRLFCVLEREKEVVTGVWDAGVQSGTSTTSVSSNERSHICLLKVSIFCIYTFLTLFYGQMFVVKIFFDDDDDDYYYC